MADELVGPVGCGQDGDRDQAPVAGRQAGAFPDVPEQDVVGELDHLGREVAEQPLGGSLLFFHGGFLFSLPAHEDLCWALARRVRPAPRVTTCRPSRLPQLKRAHMPRPLVAPPSQAPASRTTPGQADCERQRRCGGVVRAYPQYAALDSHPVSPGLLQPCRTSPLPHSGRHLGDVADPGHGEEVVGWNLD